MTSNTFRGTVSAGLRGRGRDESGQAFIEFAFVFLMMIIMLFALIDFTRIIYEHLILVNLTREGSNLASRNTTLSNTVDAVINSANPLNLNTKGRVIVTVVTNNGSGVFYIKDQLSKGGISVISKVGNGVGSRATLPATPVPIPQPNQVPLFVTEVFYSFAPITPIGQLLRVTLPSRLYDVAYF